MTCRTAERLFRVAREPTDMGKRLTAVFTRAKYAAIGAAVGAAVGGLFSRNAASTGGGLGALAGATVGEKRTEAEALVEDVRD